MTSKSATMHETSPARTPTATNSPTASIPSFLTCLSWQQQQNNLTNTYLTPPSTSPIHRGGKSPASNLLLAHHDANTIIVYQAYNASIAAAAVERNNFTGSAFSFGRTTWIKPSFSWMMHRSAWGTKHNQERILALRLHRQYFDTLLQRAVATSFAAANGAGDDGGAGAGGCAGEGGRIGGVFSSKEEWREALKASDVVVQWDPEHHIVDGRRLTYRVIQIGVRGEALEGFRGEGIVSIEDVTEFVRGVRKRVLEYGGDEEMFAKIETPMETLYEWCR